MAKKSKSLRAFEEWEQSQPPYSNENSRWEAYIAGWAARGRIDSRRDDVHRGKNPRLDEG